MFCHVPLQLWYQNCIQTLTEWLDTIMIKINIEITDSYGANAKEAINAWPRTNDFK